MKKITPVELMNLCLIYDGESVLVQEKTKSGGLIFPGGHIEQGESILESVIREVREETGLTIRNPKFCGIKDWCEADGTRCLVLLYKSSQFTGTLKSSAEGKVFWLNRNELDNANLIWNMKELLNIFEYNSYSELFIRETQGVRQMELLGATPNIFLIGFMGAGKSTVARVLRDEFGMRLVEMDEQIEAEEGRSITQIFAESGESYFRSLETRLLKDLAQEENTVVSCGGGVPMREENVAAMRQSGKIVYLSAQSETIYDRIKDSHTRPLLEGNMNIEYIEQLILKRLPKYLAAANLKIETDGKDARELGREIYEKICPPVSAG